MTRLPNGTIAKLQMEHDKEQEQLKRQREDERYWTELFHQYAGMAMQGILSCPEWNIVPRAGVSHAQECALQAQEFAHALVEKLKDKEERK